MSPGPQPPIYNSPDTNIWTNPELILPESPPLERSDAAFIGWQRASQAIILNPTPEYEEEDSENIGLLPYPIFHDDPEENREFIDSEQSDSDNSEEEEEAEQQTQEIDDEFNTDLGI